MNFYRVIGHRGVPSQFPENTLGSFRRALELGVDAIELDIRLTKDRRLVVTHDETVDRCSNGSGFVRDFSFGEIRKLDFGSWKGAQFAGTCIPTFEEALDLIFSLASTDFELLIELKENDDQCTEAICRELKHRGVDNRCTVLSFHANQLEHAHRILPELRLQGFRSHDFKTSAPEIEAQLTRICIWREQLTHEEIKQAHAGGIEVDTVPVDNAEQLDRILPFDLDTVTTNAADVLLPLLRERGLRLPNTNPSWRLHGTGLEQLTLDPVSLSPCASDELLVQIDAIGLCFSDVKLIRAGESHPKIRKNLTGQPLTPGHEAVMTIVQRGRQTPERFAPGSRWVIQCDIFIDGKSCAFGYGMDGGLTRYARLDRRVWEGETHSWLLPCPTVLTHAAAALVEPWTCVNAAYRIGHRDKPQKGGNVLIATEPGNQTEWKAGELLRQAEAANIVTWNLAPQTVKQLEQELNRPLYPVSELPESMEFDDIFCCEIEDPAFGEALLAHAARSAIVSFSGRAPEAAWKLDVGALHYRNLYYQGDTGTDLSAPYRQERRLGIKPGGSVWFAGGAGAMGQMHVQLAIESATPPARILVTDLDDARIAHVKQRLAPLAEKAGITLVLRNPGSSDAKSVDQMLNDFAPDGFDDLMILVPSAAVAQQGAKHMKAGALMNVFAGIPAGETAAFPIAATIGRGCRFTGSSGSSLDDMADTLSLAASGNLRTERAMAAIAGMNAVKEGLQAVAAGRFPGKTVVFPFCPALPLTPLNELAAIAPEVAAALDADGCWTAEAEQLLLQRWSCNA